MLIRTASGEEMLKLWGYQDVNKASPTAKYFYHNISTAYLCAFRVKREYRRHGLGSRMMETVLADLKASGFRRATIGVSEERNEKLYRRMGFTTKIKNCYFDPCAMDENMQPRPDEEGFLLLSKEL